jgi:hypothetical protein
MYSRLEGEKGEWVGQVREKLVSKHTMANIDAICNKYGNV